MEEQQATKKTGLRTALLLLIFGVSLLSFWDAFLFLTASGILGGRNVLYMMDTVKLLAGGNILLLCLMLGGNSEKTILLLCKGVLIILAIMTLLSLASGLYFLALFYSILALGLYKLR